MILRSPCLDESGAPCLPDRWLYNNPTPALSSMLQLYLVPCVRIAKIYDFKPWRRWTNAVLFRTTEVLRVLSKLALPRCDVIINPRSRNSSQMYRKQLYRQRRLREVSLCTSRLFHSLSLWETGVHSTSWRTRSVSSIKGDEYRYSFSDRKLVSRNQ